MSEQFQLKGTCLTIMLPRELDHPQADKIRRETDRILSQCYVRTIVFDFESTEFMDSSGIGMIMGRYKALGMIPGCVRAVHVKEHTEKILRLSGLHGVMEIQSETAEKGEEYGKHQ